MQPEKLRIQEEMSRVMQERLDSMTENALMRQSNHENLLSALKIAHSYNG